MSGNAASPYISAFQFRWLTSLYDTVVRTAARERQLKWELIDQTTLQRCHQVLDSTCGTGTLSILVKQRYPEQEVSAINGAPAILSITERKVRKSGVALRFDQGISQDLSYPDTHFERLLSGLFFHHLSWQGKHRSRLRCCVF